MNKLSIMEQLCFSTVRIETTDVNKRKYSGTGFFLHLHIDDKTVPLIVTNKHVVKGMVTGAFIMTIADSDENPMYKDHYPAIFTGGFEQHWIFHPDKDIDLCVMPFNSILEYAKKAGNKDLFHRCFDSKSIPQKEQFSDIDVAEEVLMIGYPNGLWDELNNMPLVRKGIISTNISLDHNGKREFVIDAACFPGSSGSPVVICNSGYHKHKHGGISMGGASVPKLIGILYAGPQQTVTGDIQVVTIPTLQQQVQSISRIPNNLGYIIKADALLDFIPIIKQRYNL